MWPLAICGGLPGWFCQNTGVHTLRHTPCVHASQLLADGPLCYADRTLVATMFETLTDVNSSSPSQILSTESCDNGKLISGAHKKDAGNYLTALNQDSVFFKDNNL